MRNCSTSTLISILVILGFTFFANTGFAQEIIVATDEPSRHYLSFNNEIKEISLQQLKPGETYKVFISSEHYNCTPSFVIPNTEDDLVLEFEALSDQQNIQLDKSCNFPIEIRFSVACISCPKEATSRNLMGIMVDENYTPTTLVRDIFIGGDCFDVPAQSISYTGNELARGYFSNGESSINIEEGVILSTGNIYNSAGPNNNYNTGNSFFAASGDVDLSQMVNTNSLYDISSLEFDFTPTTDQISFDFVFASEEYCEYVNSNFNDVFGFFISGPGINGPFSNNAENIAIVPGTNAYTAINTVNHLSNSPFYVNNIPIAQHPEMPSNLQCTNYPTNTNGLAINNIEYDGFTTAMTAMIDVEACETYHIKLIIADVADGYFDSAVFLKANSFSSGDAAEVSTETLGGGVDSNILYESCEVGYFVFERANNNLDTPLTINYTVSPSGTAIPGEDYEALPDFITIPAGDSVFYLPVNVYNDLILEGSETIILELDAPCSCDQPSVLMYIEDADTMTILMEDIVLCTPDSITLDPQISGGIQDYTYLWNTGDTTTTIDIYATSDTIYAVTITDECGNTASAFSSISIIEAPDALISGNESLCPESPLAFIQIDFTGSGPWNIVYSIDNVPQTMISGITDNPFLLSTTTVGTFQLESVSSYNCSGDVQGTAIVTAVDLEIEIIISPETCPGAEDGSISVIPGGGTGPYSFEWNNGIGTVQNPIGLGAGDYELIVSDDNGCSITEQINLPLDGQVPFADAGLEKTLYCNQNTVTLSGSGSNGSEFSYFWTTNDGNIISGANSLTPVVDEPGTYTLNVTNNNTECMIIDKTEVFIDTIAPIVALDILGPLALDCSQPITTLDASGSTPIGSLTFEWLTNDGNIISGDSTMNPEVNAGGTYELIITNTINGCTSTGNIFINSNMELPEIVLQTPAELNCLDSVVTLQSGGSSSGANFEILWTSAGGNILNGMTTANPTVDQPGTYVLTIFNSANGCENTDSLVVIENREAPIADAGMTIEMDCNDEVVFLDGSMSSEGADFLYEWSSIDGNIQNGINSLQPGVSTAGTYTLIVTNANNACTTEDFVIVTEDEDLPNAADFEIFAPLCFGENGSISVTTVYGGETPYVYSVDGGNNFFTQNFFSNLPSGITNVIIQDAAGCLYAEEVTIPGVPELSVQLIPEVTINLGESYEIDAIVSIPEMFLDSIIWTPEQTLSCNNCLNPVAFPFQTTNYEITVVDENGCPALAEILVRVDKDRKVYIPNAFSPNEDGNNDHFMIYAKEGLVTKITRFQIFNRWGGKVFDVSNALPNDFTFGWDGRVKGKVMNPGVFVYLAEIEFIDGEKIIYKGDITLTN